MALEGRREVPAVIRLQEFREALLNAYRNQGLEMSREDATEITWTVLDLFDQYGYCLDNALEDSERSIIYILEEHGMVKPEILTSVIAGGREWRTTRWRLDGKKIEKLRHTVFVEPDTTRELYESLPDSLYRGIVPDGYVFREPQEAVPVIMEEKELKSVERVKKAPRRRYGTGQAREMVRELASQGLTQKEIAQRLGVTQASVHYHRMKILGESREAVPSGTLEELLQAVGVF